jgi:2-dehydropantoate 2-reductase
VLQAWSAPVTGILDIGAYPSGVDKTAEAIAGALRASSFHSEPRHDIMRWKYAKLLMNLGNAIEAICGPSGRRGALNARAREEGVACLNAAGMDYVSDEEDKARRGSILRVAPIGNQDRPGGSSWQSLQRQTHTIEADYLNGEVALLGRIHHIPTPVNTLLQRLANQFAREGRPPGSMSVEELAALLRDGN